MSLSSTYTGTAPSSVSATIYCPDHYPGTGTTTQRKDIGSMSTTSLTAGGSYSKTISNSDTFTRLTSKDEGTMNCYIDVTAIVSGTTYTGRFAVALEATTIVWTFNWHKRKRRTSYIAHSPPFFYFLINLPIFEGKLLICRYRRAIYAHNDYYWTNDQLNTKR